MSMSSSVFRQKQSDFSADIQDLRQQNRLLYEQNITLKRSLEELININTELTESIEQFNNSHEENFPHINQQEIEQLAHQVIELQQELERERIQSRNIRQSQFTKHNRESTDGKIVEEMVKVVEELVGQFKEMQIGCKGEVERLGRQLDRQQEEWVTIAANIDQKLTKFQAEYSKLLVNYQSASQGELRPVFSRKQMKISTTIQDLKQTLDKQIQEKNRVIKIYEQLMEAVKEKLNTKI